MATQTPARVLRSRREIRLMRTAGLLVWKAHQAAARLIRPGVTTAELNRAIAEQFELVNAEPLFLGYPGDTPFPAESCISVNEQVVHGIPSDRTLVEGDIVSIDTGCRLHGWCGDAAITHPVGQIASSARKLLETTRGVLDLAIELMASETTWSQVAAKMQEFVESKKLSVVKSMVGHAIGREMHEPPQAPNYFDPEWAKDHDFDLRPGVVLAVEPMVNLGTDELTCLPDGWTMVTKDRSLSAHFEHTIAITSNGPRRLTAEPTEDEFTGLPDWLQDRERWVRW